MVASSQASSETLYPNSSPTTASCLPEGPLQEREQEEEEEEEEEEGGGGQEEAKSIPPTDQNLRQSIVNPSQNQILFTSTSTQSTKSTKGTKSTSTSSSDQNTKSTKDKNEEEQSTLLAQQQHSESNTTNLLFLLLALFQGYIFFNVTRKSFTLANTNLIETLDLKKSDIGIISSSFTTVYGISKLLGSIMTDVVDSTLLFCGSLFLSGAVCLCFPFFTDISIFCVLWSINGLIQGAGWPSLAKLCADRVPSNYLGKAISVMTAAGNIGSVVAPVLVMFPQAYFFGEPSSSSSFCEINDGSILNEKCRGSSQKEFMPWQGIMLISGIYGIVGAIIAFGILNMTASNSSDSTSIFTRFKIFITSPKAQSMNVKDKTTTAPTTKTSLDEETKEEPRGVQQRVVYEEKSDVVISKENKREEGKGKEAKIKNKNKSDSNEEGVWDRLKTI